MKEEITLWLSQLDNHAAFSQLSPTTTGSAEDHKYAAVAKLIDLSIVVFPPFCGWPPKVLLECITEYYRAVRLRLVADWHNSQVKNWRQVGKVVTEGNWSPGYMARVGRDAPELYGGVTFEVDASELITAKDAGLLFFYPESEIEVVQKEMEEGKFDYLRDDWDNEMADLADELDGLRMKNQLTPKPSGPAMAASAGSTVLGMTNSGRSIHPLAVSRRRGVSTGLISPSGPLSAAPAITDTDGCGNIVSFFSGTSAYGVYYPRDPAASRQVTVISRMSRRTRARFFLIHPGRGVCGIQLCSEGVNSPVFVLGGLAGTTTTSMTLIDGVLIAGPIITGRNTGGYILLIPARASVEVFAIRRNKEQVMGMQRGSGVVVEVISAKSRDTNGHTPTDGNRSVGNTIVAASVGPASPDSTATATTDKSIRKKQKKGPKGKKVRKSRK